MIVALLYFLVGMAAVVAFVYLQRRDMEETKASLLFMLAILLWPIWILFMVVEWFFFREDLEDLN